MTNSSKRNQNKNKYNSNKNIVIIIICGFLMIGTVKNTQASSAATVPMGITIQIANIIGRVWPYIENMFNEITSFRTRNDTNALSYETNDNEEVIQDNDEIDSQSFPILHNTLANDLSTRLNSFSRIINQESEQVNLLSELFINTIEDSNSLDPNSFTLEDLFQEFQRNFNIVSTNNLILNQFSIFGDLLDINRSSQELDLIDRFVNIDNHPNLHTTSLGGYIITLGNNNVVFGTANIIRYRMDMNSINTHSLLIHLHSDDNFDLGIIINNNNAEYNYRLVRFDDRSDIVGYQNIQMLHVVNLVSEISELCEIFRSNINIIQRIRANNRESEYLLANIGLGWVRWNSNFALNIVIPLILRGSNHNNINERYLISDDTFVLSLYNCRNLFMRPQGNNNQEGSEIAQLQRNDNLSSKIISRINSVIREDSERFNPSYITLLFVLARIELYNQSRHINNPANILATSTRIENIVENTPLFRELQEVINSQEESDENKGSNEED